MDNNNEFNDFLNDLYSSRDAYSRGYIIDAIRQKYKELHNSKHSNCSHEDWYNDSAGSKRCIDCNKLWVVCN